MKNDDFNLFRTKRKFIKMKRGAPISPEEIPAAKALVIPGFVFDAFNECIAEKFTNGRATVYQKDVVAKIKASDEFKALNPPVFNYDWLNVEDAYRATGFTVTYDKPAYCETYDTSFEFSKKK